MDEFKENPTEPFKSSSDATKILMCYWDMVAKRYLKETLTTIVNLLAAVNKTVSMEIDPRYACFFIFISLQLTT